MAHKFDGLEQRMTITVRSVDFVIDTYAMPRAHILTMIAEAEKALHGVEEYRKAVVRVTVEIEPFTLPLPGHPKGKNG